MKFQIKVQKLTISKINLLILIQYIKLKINYHMEEDLAMNQEMKNLIL